MPAQPISANSERGTAASASWKTRWAFEERDLGLVAGAAQLVELAL